MRGNATMSSLLSNMVRDKLPHNRICRCDQPTELLHITWGVASCGVCVYIYIYIVTLVLGKLSCTE